tara:strand:+ start:25918 stop:27057 length:1140 start_codon:yes stop_codon:yes gene_type:complete
MTSARKFHTIEGTFAMQRGVLTDPVVAYETWGELNEKRDNAVLIFTGLSPSAHATSSPDDPATGWWEGIVGPDCAIDTNRFFVICMNSLGSCFGTTGPASINPDSGKHYRLDFPALHIEDIGKVGYELIQSFGIKKLFSTVGPSMGGMTALAFLIQFPDVSESFLSISSAARALPFAIALRSLQRETIRTDPAWGKGSYPFAEGPIIGMRLARKLGMMTYRSAQEFDKRFGRERISEERQTGDPFCIDFEVESYLEAHASKFVGSFDANCYLYLSRAMDLFDAAEHGGSLEAGLARVCVDRAMLIGVESDILFPIHQQRELAEGLDVDGRQVEFIELPSIQGHDSFLVDMDRFRPVITHFFNQQVLKLYKKDRDKVWQI